MSVTKILLIIINLAFLLLTACKGEDIIATQTVIVSPIPDKRVTPYLTILPSATITWYLIKTPTPIPTVSFFSPPFPESTIIAEKTADSVKITPAPKVTSVLVESYEFVTRWGKKGTGNGEFLCPIRIAVDTKNYIYVVDRDNTCIQKFDSSGKFITRWGSKGKEKGQFNNPSSIGVSSKGHVFITDLNNLRIQIFDSNGNFIKMWNTEGYVTGKVYWYKGYAPGDYWYIRPYEVAVDLDENIYIPDTETGLGILKFDFNGKPIKDYLSSNFPSMGHKFGQIVIDYNEYIYTIYANYTGDNSANSDYDYLCIQKYDPNSKILKIVKKLGSKGNKDGQFRSMMGLAIDSKGYIYTADPVAGRIQKFDSSGNFITKWNSDKAGNEKFKPTGIAIDSEGNVYVTDPGNYCIQKFRQKN
jgi:DNA-binding beta-propeller fold protein YncE